MSPESLHCFEIRRNYTHNFPMSLSYDTVHKELDCSVSVRCDVQHCYDLQCCRVWFGKNGCMQTVSWCNARRLLLASRFYMFYMGLQHIVYADYVTHMYIPEVSFLNALNATTPPFSPLPLDESQRRDRVGQWFVFEWDKLLTGVFLFQKVTNIYVTISVWGDWHQTLWNTAVSYT